MILSQIYAFLFTITKRLRNIKLTLKLFHIDYQYFNYKLISLFHGKLNIGKFFFEFFHFTHNPY